MGWDVPVTPGVVHRHHGDSVDWESGITQTAATDELTREQRGGTLVWVGASSVTGCTFWGAAQFHPVTGTFFLPPLCLRMAALVLLSLGQDHAGAAARGAVGVLITLLLIEDHLHLVI